MIDKAPRSSLNPAIIPIFKCRLAILIIYDDAFIFLASECFECPYSTKLAQAVKVLKSYFGGHVTVNKVRDSSTLIYAIMDEVMDYGYPQILAPEILKEYILEKV